MRERQAQPPSWRTSGVRAPRAADRGAVRVPQRAEQRGRLAPERDAHLGGPRVALPPHLRPARRQRPQQPRGPGPRRAGAVGEEEQRQPRHLRHPRLLAELEQPRLELGPAASRLPRDGRRVPDAAQPHHHADGHLGPGQRLHRGRRTPVPPGVVNRLAGGWPGQQRGNRVQRLAARNRARVPASSAAWAKVQLTVVCEEKACSLTGMAPVARGGPQTAAWAPCSWRGRARGGAQRRGALAVATTSTWPAKTAL